MDVPAFVAKTILPKDLEKARAVFTETVAALVRSDQRM